MIVTWSLLKSCRSEAQRGWALPQPLSEALTQALSTWFSCPSPQKLGWWLRAPSSTLFQGIPCRNRSHLT